MKKYFDIIKNKINSTFPYSGFNRPIFIISPPRSGSNFLFECLAISDELFKLKSEADFIWWKHFPYETRPGKCDFVGSDDATDDNIKSIRRSTYWAALDARFGREINLLRRTYSFGLRNIRYLDKTVANCFHLDFINKAFPDALYIFLVRDPRANIGSMMEGWSYLSRFGKPQLNHMVEELDSTVEHWTYPAPPGWQKIVSKPLPEICAWSWEKHIEYAMKYFDEKADKNRMFKIRYEDLIDNTVQTVAALCENIKIEMKKEMLDYAESKPFSKTTVSPPEKEKWKKKYREEILSIIPMIQDTAQSIGYDI